MMNKNMDGQKSKVFTFQSAPDSHPVRFVVFEDQDIDQAAENTSYYGK